MKNCLRHPLKKECCFHFRKNVKSVFLACAVRSDKTMEPFVCPSSLVPKTDALEGLWSFDEEPKSTTKKNNNENQNTNDNNTKK